MRKHQLAMFFGLSLAISWSIWIPEALARLTSRQTTVAGGGPADLLAVWAPAISAMVLSRLSSGKPGLRALLHPLREWRVPGRWYALVLLYPVAVWLVARGIDGAFGRDYELVIPILTFFPADQRWMIPVALVSAIPNTLGEELGWRGYALPRLQAKWNALGASLALGVFWGVWHLPLWIAGGGVSLVLLERGLTIAAASILYTWVYNNTNGSVLLAWLFHASMTITKYLLPSTLTITDILLPCAVAVLVVVMAGPAHLSRTHKRQALLASPAPSLPSSS